MGETTRSRACDGQSSRGLQVLLGNAGGPVSASTERLRSELAEKGRSGQYTRVGGVEDISMRP